MLRVVLDGGCLTDGRASAGIGRYARELSSALSQRDDIEVHLAMPSSPPRSESRPGRFLHEQPAVWRETRRHRPHVVHALGGEPVLGVETSRQVVTVHDVELWRDLRTAGAHGLALRGYRNALLGLYRRCAAIIAVSRTTAEEAIVTLRLDPSHVHVVPHGVGPDFRPDPQPDDTRARTAMGLPASYLLWAGSLRRHDPRKGLDWLLDALALMDRPPVLALAGGGEAEAGRLRRRARLLRLDLVVCGPLDDRSLAAAYRGAEALVLPSLHEGFGLPALEAMASGCPVVATTAGNLPELAGGAALLVPPRDAPALSQAIVACLRDPTRRGEARHAGLERARAFSWPRSAELTIDVYRRVARTG